MAQGRYNSLRDELFVPVHTLISHLFIYIMAGWASDREPDRQRERETGWPFQNRSSTSFVVVQEPNTSVVGPDEVKVALTGFYGGLGEQVMSS